MGNEALYFQWGLQLLQGAFSSVPTKSNKIFPLWDTFPWSVKRQDMKMLNSHLPIEIQMRGGPTKAM